MAIANAFIVLLLISAAWLGAAAVVEKRSVRRDQRAHSSSNAAS